MNNQELAAAVEAAELALNEAVASARAAGLVVDLFVSGATTAEPLVPSYVVAEVREITGGA